MNKLVEIFITLKHIFVKKFRIYMLFNFTYFVFGLAANAIPAEHVATRNDGIPWNGRFGRWTAKST